MTKKNLTKKGTFRTVKGTSKYGKSSVSKLRVMTGLSEAEFAKICGIKINAYKSLVKRQDEKDAGTSAEFAFQISVATGACPTKLRSNLAYSAETNEEYTYSDYLNYKEYCNSVTERWKSDFADAVGARFSKIVDHLKERDTSEFLSGVVALGCEVDILAKTHGAHKNILGNLIKPSLEESIRNVAGQFPSDTDESYNNAENQKALIKLLDRFLLSYTMRDSSR